LSVLLQRLIFGHSSQKKITSSFSIHSHNAALWSNVFENVRNRLRYNEKPITLNFTILKLDGREEKTSIRFPSTVHGFQLLKLFGMPKFDHLYTELNKTTNIDPMSAYRVCHNLVAYIDLRPDWNTIRYDVMKALVWTKVNTDRFVNNLLRSTGDWDLVKMDPTDCYWGVGKCGDGKNILGKIYMDIRDDLKNNVAPKEFIVKELASTTTGRKFLDGSLQYTPYHYL
jgi:ribA/ribD-fused uncharacterized protein